MVSQEQEHSIGKRWAAAITAILLLCRPVNAATRYVDVDSTSPQSPYTNAAHAATTIQAAINVSASNDLILVSAGVYSTGTRVVDGSMKNRVVIDRAVTVRGVEGRDVTIIKGAGPAGNGGVRCVWLGANATLDGFTLKNGHTRTAGDVYTEQSGGGVYAYGKAGAVVTNCIISNCVGYKNGGGGMGGTYYDCRLEGNTVPDRSGFAGDGGGACRATLYDCVVRDNYAEDEGGGIYGSTAYRCLIDGNESPEGGGIYWGSATASIICNNIGTFGGGSGSGTLRDCLLYGNYASYRGGGASGGRLMNCTVVSNSSYFGAGVYGGQPHNCIIWANIGTTNVNWDGSWAGMSHCCTTPLPEGEGNITNAPAFVNAAAHDYRLLPSSPCLDAGSNVDVITGVDLDGRNRIVRGRVDMGPYEKQGPVADMPLIPAGSFVMGATTNMGHESYAGETPQHTVAIGDFYMDRYEVSMARWNAVCAWATNHGYTAIRPATTNGPGPTAKGPEHPVTGLQWIDGPQWCNARSEMEGLTPCYTNSDGTVWRSWSSNGYTYACDWTANGYRLPTEAEWEKAARGGTPDHRFPWTDTDNIGHARANYLADPGTYAYDTNAAVGYHPAHTNGGLPYTSPVGSFGTNGYGLCDMAGNTAEYCWDWYSAAYYAVSPGTDPRGPAAGGGTPQRVIRGGSYSNVAAEVRVAWRDAGVPDNTSPGAVGLRTVRRSWHSVSNNAPVIEEGSSVTKTVVEGVDPTPYTWGLNATDADGDALRWLVGAGNHGATVTAGRTGTTNTVVYTPAPGFTGADTVAVQVYDGHGGIDTIAVNLYIEPAEPTLTVVSEYGVADPAVGVHTNTHGDTVICRVSGHDVSGGGEYLCTGWVLEGQKSTNNRTSGSTTNVGITTTRDATLTWQWEAASYRLTVLTNGGGSVTAAGGWYDPGATTVLTATASLYWPFSHWSGDTNGCGITGNTITVRMTQSRSIAANFAFEPPAGPLTRYVDDDSSDPQAPYTNVANAATTIQDAVDVSFSNDLILVSAGVYDTGTRVVHGSMKNRVVIDVPVTVRGIGGTAATIIKGAGPVGDGAVRCVYLGTNAVLEGFTLTNGHTRAAGDYVTERNGGGVWCEPGAVVSNCVISGNSAEQDGGGAFRGTLHDCEFVGNSCLDDGGGASESVLIGCLLHRNHTDDEGGATASSIVTACLITNNTSTGSGGGCILGTLRDCLIAHNTAENSGGGTIQSTLHNCTVVDNQAFAGGGVYGGAMTNCIVWGNTGLIGPNWEPSAFASPPSHCCTTPEPAGEGHTTENPLFVDASRNDYRLKPGSPCINTGTNAPVTTSIDLDGRPRIVFGTVDMGAYEYVSSAHDYDGDGMSNDEEAVAGTDSTDPNSRLAVVRVVLSNGVTVTWIGGTTARQVVETRTNLTSATESWVAVYTNEPMTPVTNVMTLPAAPADVRFYRIRAVVHEQE